MIETHPFGINVPIKSRYLLLGSFTTKEAYGENTKRRAEYDWYYSNGRNQFWPILEGVYKIELKTKKAKQELFKGLRMALGDIIHQCERKKGTNLDNNLTNIVYNIKAVEKVLKNHKIEKIYFSSRFVENKFKKVFKGVLSKYPHIKLITLPSPSPRYAKLTIREKVVHYKKVLPKQSS